jgi:hypothetical protein
MPSFPAAHPRALRRQNLGKLQSPARHRNRNACHPERTRWTSHNLATSRKFRLRAICISIKSYRSRFQSVPPSLGRALSDRQSDSGGSKPTVGPKQRLALSIWCAEDVTLRRHHHVVESLGEHCRPSSSAQTSARLSLSDATTGFMERG